jgi:hypothetical protein
MRGCLSTFLVTVAVSTANNQGASSSSPSELSGTIEDARGSPATEFFVIAFSRDQAHWSPQSRRIRSARPGNDGRFVFANLPPGEYALAAVTDVEPNEWFDPAFLKQLEPASIAITIGEGEKKVQNIRTQGGNHQEPPAGMEPPVDGAAGL